MTGTRASTPTFHHFFPKMESPFAAALAPADENNPMYVEGAPDRRLHLVLPHPLAGRRIRR